MRCPCKTAKRLITAVINLTDFWLSSQTDETKYNELKMDLIQASKPFRLARQIYENNKNTEKE